MAIDGNNIFALNNKGLALSKLGKYPEAIECYEKALAIDGNYSIALNNKGDALFKLGRYPEAIECFEKALDSKDEDSLI